LKSFRDRVEGYNTEVEKWLSESSNIRAAAQERAAKKRKADSNDAKDAAPAASEGAAQQPASDRAAASEGAAQQPAATPEVEKQIDDDQKEQLDITAKRLSQAKFDAQQKALNLKGGKRSPPMGKGKGPNPEAANEPPY